MTKSFIKCVTEVRGKNTSQYFLLTEFVVFVIYVLAIILKKDIMTVFVVVVCRQLLVI